MNKFSILIISGLLFISVNVFGQVGKLDIYMKDGSIISGSIKSQDGESAVIQLLSGSEIVIPVNQVKKTAPMNSIPADSIYRTNDYSKHGLSLSNNTQSQSNPATAENSNIEDFVKLKSGKIIYGDVVDDSGFLSSVLIVNGSQKIQLSDVVEYRLNPDEHFVREPGLFGSMLKGKINGRIQVFETHVTNFTQGAPVMTGPGQWSSGPTRMSTTVVKYFRVSDTAPLLEFDADNLLPVLKSEPTCADLIKKYEEAHKTSTIIKVASWGFIGGGLVYFLSAENKKEAIGLTAGLSIVGSVLSFIPGSENKYLDQAVDVYNRAKK